MIRNSNSPFVARAVALISGLALTVGGATTLLAGPPKPVAPTTSEQYPLKRSNPGPIQFVETPASAFAPGDVANVIYLNRCNDPEEPCLVRASSRNDSTTDESTIPSQNSTLSAFDVDDDGMTNPNSTANDELWDAYVSCVSDLFAPYDVVITETDPGTTAHTEIKTGGFASQIGYPPGSGVLGVAPGAAGCSPFRNSIVFVFANEHPAAYANPTTMIEEMCAAAAQEAAHAFTLDHVGSCTDPMTYEGYCGTRKYFRNLDIRCGAFENNQPSFPSESPRDCKCGAPKQNAHKSLLGFFGAGVEPAPPSLTITSPADGAALGAGSDVTVALTSLHERGLNRIDVYVNGWLWGTNAGKSPEAQGTGAYTIILPKDVVGMPDTVPNGVIDLEVRAYNDLEGTPAIETITITKGAACTNAATDCAQGQLCESGKCFWNAPTLELGETCEYNQACTSASCQEAGGEMRCSQACNTISADSCPANFECLATAGSAGVCWPASKEGCAGCAANGSSSGELAFHLLFAAMLTGWLLRRRAA
ncbi:MAG: hypothetical protein IPL79_17160 [Myxococcales bacterium]|nr:hypothetical protein [Myxococcales bacterium]